MQESSIMLCYGREFVQVIYYQYYSFGNGKG